MKIPRVLLAAGSSGSGKTLITCGILQALVNRGKDVASFKCGPDYIDPMFHSRVIGTRSGNLDTFFTGDEVTRYLMGKNAETCDIAVIEGVMGYYDGLGGMTSQASAYDLATVTDTPVILIVNSRGMSVSLTAYIKGFLEYRSDSHIKGVIFNQMSPMLYPRMKTLVEQELGIEVLGYVPQVDDCVIESRHLGLVLPEEIPMLKERLEHLSEVLEQTLDLERLLALAEEASELNTPTRVQLCEKNPSYGFRLSEPVRIAVADDEAFCFFYEDNFRLLQEMGAELIRFSPIHDSAVPNEIDGLLLYGGYPELYGEQLEANVLMRSAVHTHIEQGLPCMAECGGFMYLHEELEDMDGAVRKMAGVISGKVFRTKRLQRFGYITLHQKRPVLDCEDLGGIPAHEFHYFDSTDCGSAFAAEKPLSSRSWECMHADQRKLIGFPHLHYYGNPHIAEAFLKQCLRYKNERQRRTAE